MTIVGVDGCPAGWIAVCQERSSGTLQAHVVGCLTELFDKIGVPQIVTIDIPIGLLDEGSRLCDIEARKRLGSRGCCVFPAPIRPALEAGSYADASATRRQVEGKGVSAQAFGIYKKVREIDELLCENPALVNILFEVHPEVSFAAWNASPFTTKKATEEGFKERLALTEPLFGQGIFDQIRSQFKKRDVSNDDILDALGALWTAQRIVTNSAESLPKAELRDAHGIPMRIWC